MVHTNQSLFTEQKWYLISPVAKGQWSTVVSDWQSAGVTAASTAVFYKFIYKLHEPVSHETTLNQQNWDQIDITTTHADLEPNVGYFVYVSTPGIETEPEPSSQPEPEPVINTTVVAALDSSLLDISIIHITNPELSPNVAIQNDSYNILHVQNDDFTNYLGLPVGQTHFKDIPINSIKSLIDLYHATYGLYPNKEPLVKIPFNKDGINSIAELNIGTSVNSTAENPWVTTQVFNIDNVQTYSWTNYTANSFTSDMYVIVSGFEGNVPITTISEPEPEPEPEPSSGHTLVQYKQYIIYFNSIASWNNDFWKEI